MDTVLVIAAGNATTGLWCPVCCLPTGYVTDVLALDETGVAVVGRAHGCTESDDPAHWPVVEDTLP